MRSAIVVRGLGLGLGLALIGIFAACGKEEDSTIADRDAGPEAATQLPVADGSPAVDAGDPYTLDNVCDRTAPIVCDLRKTCCGTDFNLAGCLAHQMTECTKDVAAARAGMETFHPDRIDACIPKYRELLMQCSSTWETLQKYGTELGACSIFEGQLAVGTACDRTGQCVPAAKTGDLASCDDTDKKCKVISFLGEGAACALADGVSAVCGTGLYCDVDFTKAGLPGFCKKATSVGVPCDTKKKPIQLECGLGNYCDLGTAKCTVGKPGGAACTGPNLECASLACTNGDAGTCVPVKSLAKPEECKGP